MYPLDVVCNRSFDECNRVDLRQVVDLIGCCLPHKIHYGK